VVEMKKLLMLILLIVVPVSASAYWKTLSTSKGDVTYWVSANPDSIEARLIALEQEVESVRVIILKLTKDAKQDSIWGNLVNNNLPKGFLHSPVGKIPVIIDWEDSVFFWHINKLRGLK
jgi:hypothetical protein